VILVDSNVLMYAAGADHPNKSAAIEFLGQVAAGSTAAAVDAEVLQEIIHRYRALNRWPEGRRVYLLARALLPEVLPVTGEVMDQAKELVDEDASLSARDALHAAMVPVYRLDGIFPFDRDFDRIKGCRRVTP
jgi:predicted nucleic acid-binding protein